MASPRSLLQLLLLPLLATGVLAKCHEDYEGSLHLQQLRKKLLCGYDAAAGPTVQPGVQTQVRLRLLRTRMDVDDRMDAMTLYGYIMLIWTDEWLKWSPAEYANVTRIYVDSSEIWTPKIATLEAPNRVYKEGQALVMNGTVVWTLLAPVRAPCLRDPTRWPYDKMVCNVSIVNLSPSSAVLDKQQVQFSVVKWRNKGWSMTRMQMKPFKGTAGDVFQDGLLVQVTAERNGDMHEACVLLPCVALGCMLLASLWLPADTPHRPMLLCAVILTQVLLSVAAASCIRVVGTHPPGLLLLIRDALILSGVAVLQWLLARWLRAGPGDQRPAWPLAYLADLADYTAGPGGARLAQILVLPPPTSTGASDDAVTNSKTASMAALTDRAAFLVLTVVFALLAIRLMP